MQGLHDELRPGRPRTYNDERVAQVIQRALRDKPALATHWPRARYRRFLANPRVQITRDGARRDYVAVPVADEEHARVDRDHPRALAFRVVTGFPPRRIVRLDEVEADRR